jgi:hypothetical protein
VSYRLPESNELIPLLQVVPSKNNEERLLLVSPELASVLATIVTRLRGQNGGVVPSLPRYDRYERDVGPSLPHLFQRQRGSRRTVISDAGIRGLINRTLAMTGLRDSHGDPLTFTPHDLDTTAQTRRSRDHGGCRIGQPGRDPTLGGPPRPAGC